MTYYRLYFFNGGSGPISDFDEFEVLDDDAAIAAAERCRRMAAMELWCGGRKVKRWEPIGLATASGPRRSVASAVRDLSSPMTATNSRMA